MPPAKPFTPAQRELIASAYEDDGQSLRDIATKYNCDYMAIRRVLIGQGVQLRPTASGSHRRKIHTDGLTGEQRMIKRRREQGLCTQCGKPAGEFWFCDGCRMKRRQRIQNKIATGTCGSNACQNPCEPGKHMCSEHLRYHREQHHKLRKEAMTAYGGAKCTCCGETELAFLAIDHINNDGAADRRKHGRNLPLRKLRAQGWPPGFQVLCHNCNFAKHVCGVCPHQRKTS